MTVTTDDAALTTTSETNDEPLVSAPVFDDGPVGVAGTHDTHDAEALALLTSITRDPGDPVPTIRLTVELPVDVIVALKDRTSGKLDSAETLALVAQLYCRAPLERRAVVLTESQHARVCSTLGFTPRTNDELVGAIESLTAISFGGVRVQFTAEDVELMNARNASEMAPKEFAKHVVMLGFEAWKNGTIG
jgi:hypothetical protein